MDLGFPYYWYGVHALTPDTVVISGFNNQAGFRNGVVRWSFNGGTTWQPDISLTIPVNAVGWLERIHFFNADSGIVINSFSGGCWVTASGGKDSASWNYISVNSDLGWFAGNIDAQASGRVYAAGYHFARSSDFGFNWVSGPHVDGVFDGGVDFLDNNNLMAGPAEVRSVRRWPDGFTGPRTEDYHEPAVENIYLADSRAQIYNRHKRMVAGGKPL